MDYHVISKTIAGTHTSTMANNGMNVCENI